jgi:hypothetical protein
METPESNESARTESVRLRMDPSTGAFWYTDRAGQNFILDDAAKAERTRQQADPDSEPAEGYPKYSGMLAVEKFPEVGAAEAGTDGTDSTGTTTSARPGRGLTPETGIPLNVGAEQYKLSYLLDKIRDTIDPEDVAGIEERIAEMNEENGRDTVQTLRSEIGLLALQSHLPAAGAGVRAESSPQPSAASNETNPGAQPSAAETVAPVIQLRGVVPSEFIDRSQSLRPLKESPSGLREEAPTMDQIQADPKMRDNFLVLLRGHEFESSKLIEKYAEWTRSQKGMEPEDWNRLTEARNEFKYRSALLEEVRAGMTTEEVKFMLQTEPNFAFLQNLIAPERAAEIIKLRLDTSFMSTSDTELSNMVYAFRANIDNRASSQYKGMMERARQVAGSEVVPENIVDPQKRHQMIRAGIFGKRRKTTETLTAIETNLKTQAGVLAATLSKDPELLRAISKEAAAGERVPERGGASVGPEVVREGQRNMNIETLVGTVVPEFKREYERMYQKSYAESSAAERMNNFVDYTQKRGGLDEPRMRQSWFGAMLGAILGAFLQRVKTNPRLKEALAA